MAIHAHGPIKPYKFSATVNTLLVISPLEALYFSIYWLGMWVRFKALKP